MSAPQATELYSKAHLTGEPTWLGVKLQADTDGEIWTVSNARLLYETGSVSGNADILDDVMRIQSLEVGTVPNFYDLVYQIPDEVLKLDQVDLTVELTFSTNTGLTTSPVTNTDFDVDLKTLREKFWTRIPGAQETVVTYSPGSYITLDYYGAGISAEMGVATNMGMVEATVDDAVAQASIDLFPTDLPATANVTSPPDTRYEDFSISEGGSINEDHALRLTLLSTKNSASSYTGMAVTSFTITRFTGNTLRLHELDVMTDNDNVKLFSFPAPFDGNVLLQRLGFSANWQESLPEVEEGGNTIASLIESSSSDNVKIGSTKPEASKSNKPRGNAGTASTYLIEIDDGETVSTKVSDDLDQLTLPIYKADRIHSVKVHAIGPGGRMRSSGSFYQVGLSNPITWASGEFSLTHPDLEGMVLRRDNSHYEWQVGFVESQIPQQSQQNQTILVVQRPNSQDPLDFSIEGAQSVTPLDGGSRAKTTSGGYDIEEGNHVLVKSSQNLSVSGGGGGGGGCLLH